MTSMYVSINYFQFTINQYQYILLDLIEGNESHVGSIQQEDLKIT